MWKALQQNAILQTKLLILRKVQRKVRRILSTLTILLYIGMGFVFFSQTSTIRPPPRVYQRRRQAFAGQIAQQWVWQRKLLVDKCAKSKEQELDLERTVCFQYYEAIDISKNIRKDCECTSFATEQIYFETEQWLKFPEDEQKYEGSIFVATAIATFVTTDTLMTGPPALYQNLEKLTFEFLSKRIRVLERVEREQIALALTAFFCKDLSTEILGFI